MSAFIVNLEGWDFADAADRRFKRMLTVFGVPALLLALWLPFWHLAGVERGGGDTLDNRYISLVENAEPAPQNEEPAPTPDEQPEPEKPREQQKPTPTQAPVTKPEVTQQQRVDQARQKAQQTGVLAMQDQLAALRDNTLSGLDTARPLTTDTLTAQAGSGARGGNTDLARAAAASSGGIGDTGTAEQRRSQSGVGMGERKTQQVQSPVGFGQDLTRPGQSGDKLIASRTLEEIQLMFDRNKGAITSIYNREARQNPNLGAGKVVVSLTIAPDGRVSDCKLVSSTFNNPDLERKIIQRILMINFGSKSVPAFTYPNYPITFIPS